MGRAWLPACCVAALALAGCQSAGSGPVAGPIAAYAAPRADTGSDAVFASQAARGLNPDDRGTALAAEYRALESGRAGVAVAWRSRAARGEILVGPIYRINDTDCRDYTHVITGADGQVETGRGLACRRPNGGWQPVG